MKKLCASFAVLALVFCFNAARAEEKKADDKEVTLKGTILCCKCHLKKAPKCATAIEVEKDGKKTVYVFDPESDKKYHKEICTKKQKGEVKGTVTKEGDKMIIKVTDLKFE